MVSQKWQRFWAGLLSGVAGGVVLVATNNMGVPVGIGLTGTTIGAIIFLAIIYATVID